jgi:hypothetical protein
MWLLLFYKSKFRYAFLPIDYINQIRLQLLLNLTRHIHIRTIVLCRSNTPFLANDWQNFLGQAPQVRHEPVTEVDGVPAGDVGRGSWGSRLWS